MSIWLSRCKTPKPKATAAKKTNTTSSTHCTKRSKHSQSVCKAKNQRR